MALILVAEDDRDVALLLTAALRAFGHEPVVCGDGAEALVAFGRHRPDLVVLDVRLPGGLDGLDVVEALRREGATTPVLLLTANARAEDRAAGLAAGADDHLAKPFDIEDLAERVQALLDQGST